MRNNNITRRREEWHVSIQASLPVRPPKVAPPVHQWWRPLYSSYSAWRLQLLCGCALAYSSSVKRCDSNQDSTYVPCQSGHSCKFPLWSWPCLIFSLSGQESFGDHQSIWKHLQDSQLFNLQIPQRADSAMHYFTTMKPDLCSDRCSLLCSRGRPQGSPRTASKHTHCEADLTSVVVMDS